MLAMVTNLSFNVYIEVPHPMRYELLSLSPHKLMLWVQRSHTPWEQLRFSNGCGGEEGGRLGQTNDPRQSPRARTGTATTSFSGQHSQWSVPLEDPGCVSEEEGCH